MTDRTAYYQAKNTEARLHGGLFRCPSCIGVIEKVGGLYHCGYCSYTWDADGEPLEVVT